MKNTVNSNASLTSKEIKKFEHIAVEAVVVAALAIMVSGYPYYSKFIPPVFGLNTPTEQSQVSSDSGNFGTQGVPGMSAYDLWVTMGHVGTIQDFLNSLVGETGEPGADGKVIYYGSDGITGKTGKSAYQLWLDAGNTGTDSDFLASLIGSAGMTGPQGIMGTPGKDGISGLSAYELWLAIGNSGSETDFFDQLVGATGAQGVSGDTGLSAYQIWLNNGNVGSEADFLASLKGATGATGATGLQGTPGTDHTGIFGYFYHLGDQELDHINPVPESIRFTNSPTGENGLSLIAAVNGATQIKFSKPGWYAINFSISFAKLHSNAQGVEVWFAENGTDLPDSASSFTLSTNEHTVLSGSYFYHCENPNSYIEAIWYSAEGSHLMISANKTADGHPVMPSAIVTVHQVDD